MCNPRSTKLWIKDWNDIKPENERFPQQVIDSYSKYDWIDSEDLVRDFEHKAPNLEHIHFAGGEPLLVPQMARILQKCIDSGNAKNIVITYNTNLTVLPKKVLELWKQFKGVKILASVDGIGPLNHYIRFPADWNQIDKNLHFIDEHHEEYNIQECILSVTVQALNIMHISEFYEYLNQFKFIVKAPNLVNLFHPHYFQTTVLPTQLKRIASLQLHQLEDKIRPRLEPHYHYLIDNLSGILTFMNSQDRSDTFKMFRDFQMKYDEKKKLNIMDYCPYFSHYWKLDP
jgi:MoaA/NifB/PqqE/SkfB family radical SAM enzyme